LNQASIQLKEWKLHLSSPVACEQGDEQCVRPAAQKLVMSETPRWEEGPFIWPNICFLKMSKSGCLRKHINNSAHAARHFPSDTEGVSKLEVASEPVLIGANGTILQEFF